MTISRRAVSISFISSILREYHIMLSSFQIVVSEERVMI